VCGPGALKLMRGGGEEFKHSITHMGPARLPPSGRSVPTQTPRRGLPSPIFHRHGDRSTFLAMGVHMGTHCQCWPVTVPPVTCGLIPTENLKVSLLHWQV
jgi:hypothetical protein